MPGFSQDEQARLARIVLAHRGKLAKIEGLPARSADWALVFACGSRRCSAAAASTCRCRASARNRPTPGSSSTLRAGWLDEHPLTAAALEAEAEDWRAVGLRFDVRSLPADRAQAAG